jgi:hypothetical protein
VPSAGTLAKLVAIVGVLAVLFSTGVLDWGYWKSWTRATARSAAGGASQFMEPVNVVPGKSAVEGAAACRANIRRIEQAKRLAAQSSGVTKVEVSWNELLPHLGKQRPACPSGGSYNLGTHHNVCRCTISNNRTSDRSDDHILEGF